MHPVEAAWRKFRNSEHRDLFERSLRRPESFLNSIELKPCPPEVALPLAVPWNLAALAEKQKGGKPIGTRLGASNAMLVNTIHVWAAYREAKNIYQIEPTLAECLARSPWPEQTPTQALRLQSRCPVLVIPRSEGDPSYVAAVYDLLTGEEHSGALELRISEFMKEAQWWVPICVLHLNHDHLAKCLDAAAAEAERHDAPVGEAEKVWRNELAGLTLTMLLYLGGEPDLIQIVHPGEKPLKAKIARPNATAISLSRPSNPWAKRSRALLSSGKSSIASMKALPPVAPYGRTCAAPIHTSTGPARAESSPESNSFYLLAFAVVR